MKRILFKALRGTIFGLVCVVTLIALVVTEENWRAKRAWESCKRELEAQGEHLDLAYYIPPPVPDDRNFAMTPLLKPLEGNYTPSDPDAAYPKAWQGTFREADPPVQKISKYAGYDTKTHFPVQKGGLWRAGEFRDLTLWQMYFRTVFPDIAHPQSPAEDVLATLGRIDGMFAELHEAMATRPFARFPVQYELGAGAPLRHISVLNHMAQVIALRACAELALGRNAEAFRDLQLGIRLIDTIKDEPILISGLVRISMMSILTQPLWEGIARHQWTAGQLASLQTELEGMDWLRDAEFVLQGERAEGNTLFDQMRAHPGAFFKKNEDGSVDFMMGFSSDVKNKMEALAYLKWLPPRLLGKFTCFFYRNQIYYNRGIQEKVIPLLRAKAGRVDTQLARRLQQQIHDDPRCSLNTFLGEMSVETLISIPERFAFAQTCRNETMLGCAIERYRLAHGTLPATLDELHMNNLPRDVIDGGPLRYRITGGEGYLLYSVGPDGVDNGGKVVLNQSGSVDTKQGDWPWAIKAGPAPAPKPAD